MSGFCGPLINVRQLIYRSSLGGDRMAANVERLDNYRKTSGLEGALSELLEQLDSNSQSGLKDTDSLGSSRLHDSLTEALVLLSKASASIEMMDRKNKEIKAWADQRLREAKLEIENCEDRIQTYDKRAKLSERLAQEYGSLLSAAEQRALEAEARATRSEALLNEVESRISSAEARANRAEIDAKESERWLAHVSDLIHKNLSGAKNIFTQFDSVPDLISKLDLHFRR